MTQMGESSKDITCEVALSPDLDNHLNNLIQCISDDEHGEECDISGSMTSSHHLTCVEQFKNCNSQHSPILNTGFRSSFELIPLSPLCNPNEGIEAKKCKNIEIQDDKQVVTELLVDPQDVKANVLSKIMPTDFSKQVTNNNDKESIYRVLTQATNIPEIKKTFQRRNSSHFCSEIKESLKDRDYCPSSSWPGDSSKLRKRKHSSDSYLNNAKNGCNTDSARLTDEDVSRREQTEELLLEKSQLPHDIAKFGQEMLNEVRINCKTMTSIKRVSQSVNHQEKSEFKVQVTSQCLSDEPDLVQESVQNRHLNSTDVSPVSLKISVMDSNVDAQHDVHSLCFTGKPASESTSVPVNKFLVQQPSSSSEIVPKELPNEPEVSSVVSTSPLGSSNSPQASAQSPKLLCDGSSHNENPRSVELFSSSTSVESSCDSSSITQQTEKLPIKCLPESPLQMLFTGDVSETSYKDLTCNHVPNVPHPDVTLPLPTVSSAITPLQFELQDRSVPLRKDEIDAVMPTVDTTEKITNKLPSTFTKGLPVEIYETGTTSVYEKSAINISLKDVIQLNTNVPELCQDQRVKHAMNSVCEYEHQELPRSPLMLMSVDGVTHSVSDDDHIVPQFEVTENDGECILHELESSTTISDNDHNYCEEITLGLLSEAETLHSVDTGSGAVQHYKISHQNYKANQQNYEDSQQNYETNQQNYETNRQNHETNQQNYKDSQQNYETNQQNYKDSQQNYKTNQENFETNQQNYETNQQNYKNSQQNYETNQENFETNQQNYETNQQNYETNHEAKQNPPGAIQEHYDTNHKAKQQEHGAIQEHYEAKQQDHWAIQEHYDTNHKAKQQDHWAIQEHYDTNYEAKPQNHDANQLNDETNPQNHTVNQSWPKLASTCTQHCQDSSRASLSISPNFDGNKCSLAISSYEKTEHTPQLCPDKHAKSYLSNETSILPFEDTIICEEHRVPGTEPCENVCLSEISLYNDLPGNNQDDLKCRQISKQAFQWKTVYDTQMNKSLTDQTVGDSVFEGLSCIQPICQSHRPRHVGLSRKQKVEHLHSKP